MNKLSFLKTLVTEDLKHDKIVASKSDDAMVMELYKLRDSKIDKTIEYDLDGSNDCDSKMIASISKHISNDIESVIFDKSGLNMAGRLV